MNSVSIKTYRVSDLKQIYRVLHQHLLQNTDLMDSEIFEDLHAYLQGIARVSGVDVSDHSAWDRWLKEEPVQAPPPPVRRPHLRLVKS
jgi:hypothetical protein